ncbi:MAG: antibiotic biosynthesis monooxygenase [Bacteriovoracaceae bacterium]|nr:antibiotic biosynthesis monooxygenase [Bacteriovoracaceae bacterium]
MTENVSWVIQMNINSGKLEDFKTLMTEMVNSTNEFEPGALNYEWYLNGEGTNCHIYERYENSAATLTHLGNFGEKFAGRFMELATPTGITVYGNPSAEVREGLKGLGAVHYDQIGGFRR